MKLKIGDKIFWNGCRTFESVSIPGTISKIHPDNSFYDYRMEIAGSNIISSVNIHTEELELASDKKWFLTVALLTIGSRQK